MINQALVGKIHSPSKRMVWVALRRILHYFHCGGSAAGYRLHCLLVFLPCSVLSKPCLCHEEKSFTCLSLLFTSRRSRSSGFMGTRVPVLAHGPSAGVGCVQREGWTWRGVTLGKQAQPTSRSRAVVSKPFGCGRLERIHEQFTFLALSGNTRVSTIQTMWVLTHS